MDKSFAPQTFYWLVHWRTAVPAEISRQTIQRMALAALNLSRKFRGGLHATRSRIVFQHLLSGTGKSGAGKVLLCGSKELFQRFVRRIGCHKLSVIVAGECWMALVAEQSRRELQIAVAIYPQDLDANLNQCLATLPDRFCDSLHLMKRFPASACRGQHEFADSQRGQVPERPQPEQRGQALPVPSLEYRSQRRTSLQLAAGHCNASKNWLIRQESAHWFFECC